MKKELRTLAKAIQDLIEGADLDYDSVQEAFKVMKKYGYIDEDEMFDTDPEDKE